jgi:nucleoid-associated protein YgaU
MDHFLKREIKVAVLVFAILLVSACSSSKVDSTEETPETAASTDMMSDDPQAPDAGAAPGDAPVAEANTDQVPPPDEAPLPPPSADIAAAPTEKNEAPPPPDVTTLSNETPPPPDVTTTAKDETPPPPIEAADVDVESKPAVSENPALAQEPAPKALEASTSPPPAPKEEPVLSSTSALSGDDSGGTQVSGEVVRYRVKAGDTLMKIAFENYGDLYRWKDILDGNQKALKDPNEISPGTVLMLSGAGGVTIERNGEKYLIKTGDTLGLISNEVYGTQAKWKKLWENNRQMIKNPNRIYAGFNLYYVPEGRLAGDQSLPFKGASEPEQVAKGPVPEEAARAPNSQK